MDGQEDTENTEVIDERRDTFSTRDFKCVSSTTNLLTTESTKGSGVWGKIEPLSPPKSLWSAILN